MQNKLEEKLLKPEIRTGNSSITGGECFFHQGTKTNSPL